MEYYFNFYLYEKMGWLPVGTSNHVAENLPFYCNDEQLQKKYHIRRKGVLPRRQDLADAKRKEIMDVLSGEKPLPKIKMSREGLSAICEGLHTGKPERVIVSMPNQGQITNLPKDVVVETWGLVTANGVHPVMSGDMPEETAGSMLTIINEQELAVEAALTGKRELVYHAMRVSPQLQNKDAAEQLTDELLEANKAYLPQFFA